MPVPTPRTARPSTDVAPRASSRRGTGIPPGDPGGLTLERQTIAIKIAKTHDLGAAQLQMSAAVDRHLRERGLKKEEWQALDWTLGLVQRAAAGEQVVVEVERWRP